MNSRAKPTAASPKRATPRPDPASSADIAPAKARSNGLFRKRAAPLPRDDARRQGDISQLAFLTMGGRDPAIAFLNGENVALGGRPLDIATASAEGFAKVADAIRALASPPPPPPSTPPA